MKKQYIAPTIKLSSMETEDAMLVISNRMVKIDGQVKTTEGQFVDGTDWQYGGDGNSSIVPEGKDNDNWSYNVWE